MFVLSRVSIVLCCNRPVSLQHFSKANPPSRAAPFRFRNFEPRPIFFCLSRLEVSAPWWTLWAWSPWSCVRDWETRRSSLVDERCRLGLAFVSSLQAVGSLALNPVWVLFLTYGFASTLDLGVVCLRHVMFAVGCIVSVD